MIQDVKLICIAVHSCSLSFVYHYYKDMEKLALPKFEWGRIDDCNAGHTPDEWGSQQNPLKKIRFIEAYTVIWKSRENRHTWLSKISSKP